MQGRKQDVTKKKKKKKKKMSPLYYVAEHLSSVSSLLNDLLHWPFRIERAHAGPLEKHTCDSKGKVMWVMNVPEMQDTDKPCIYMEIRSNRMSNKNFTYQGLYVSELIYGSRQFEYIMRIFDVIKP